MAISIATLPDLRVGGSGRTRDSTHKGRHVTSYHSWRVQSPEQAEDREWVAIRGALTRGKAVCDQSCALRLSVGAPDRVG